MDNCNEMTDDFKQKHPDVQQKLRAELVEATSGGTVDLDYDDLTKLPYLDAVCRETLRVFAPVILSGRAYVSCPLRIHPH